MGYTAYRIVRLKYETSPLPVFAAFAVLFALTVVLNISMWEQADALYAAALMATLYCVLTRRDFLAMLLFQHLPLFQGSGHFPGAAAPHPFAEKRNLMEISFTGSRRYAPGHRSRLDCQTSTDKPLAIYPSQAGQYYARSVPPIMDTQ